MTTLEVRDGLFTVAFEGEKIADSDSFQQLPRGVRWETVSPDDAKSYLRWVEMDLFRVKQQEDPENMIRLPEGGYFFHAAHKTACYHVRNSPCKYKGIPTDAGSADLDLLPCPLCKPPLLWDPQPADPDNPLLLCDPTLVVDVEPDSHELWREATAREIVDRIIGRRLTVPARILLEKAKRNDHDIAAVFARPVMPRGTS